MFLTKNENISNAFEKKLVQGIRTALSAILAILIDVNDQFRPTPPPQKCSYILV